MSDRYFAISVCHAAKLFCKWKKSCLCAPYQGSSPASTAHRAPHAGHTLLSGMGRKIKRHKHLSFEHRACPCYCQTLFVSKSEIQPCAGSYHRCTNLALHNFITYEPSVHQQPHWGSVTSSLHTLIPVSPLSGCPNSPWVICCRRNPRTRAQHTRSAAGRHLHVPLRKPAPRAMLAHVYLVPKFSPAVP